MLKRLSVAVLVDGVYEPQPEGAPKFRERTPEELQRLTALVRGAVGADERRGDRVELVSMRFAASEAEMPQAAGGFLNLSPALTARLIESGVYALIVLLALLLVARPLVRRITVLPAATAALPAAGAAAAAVALDAPEGRPALPPAEGDGGEAMISLTQVDGQIRASSISRLGELVDTYPDETLALVRRWLAPAEVEG